MAVTVVKVGGSMLSNAPAFQQVAHRLAAMARAGPTWIVVSAMYGVTDRLVALAASPSPANVDELIWQHRQASPRPLPNWLRRALDQGITRAQAGDPTRLLAWGERASAEVMRQSLQKEGLEPEILEVQPRWPHALPPLAIVPGFYFRDGQRGVHTLPRGGSDVTAVYVAYRLGEREVRFWKDAGGIRVPDGAVAPEVEACEVLRLVGDDIRPIHPAAVRLAMNHGIDLVLENPLTMALSTRIRPTQVTARLTNDHQLRGLREALTSA